MDIHIWWKSMCVAYLLYLGSIIRLLSSRTATSLFLVATLVPVHSFMLQLFYVNQSKPQLQIIISTWEQPPNITQFFTVNWTSRSTIVYSFNTRAWPIAHFPDCPDSQLPEQSMVRTIVIVTDCLLKFLVYRCKIAMILKSCNIIPINQHNILMKRHSVVTFSSYNQHLPIQHFLIGILPSPISKFGTSKPVGFKFHQISSGDTSYQVHYHLPIRDLRKRREIYLCFIKISDFICIPHRYRWESRHLY